MTTAAAAGASPDAPRPESDRVVIFDTTLRDGEQSPGASMNLEEKLRIARVLEQMGVDIIEAGFPIASTGDFEAVHGVAELVRNSVVAALARAKRADIDRAAESLQPAARRRIHTFISTSPLHMKYKLQMEPEAVLEAVTESVTHARRFTDDVEWSAEDGSRTEHDFLCRCVEAAIKAGATTINIPDTVGYSVPAELAALFGMLRARVPGAEEIVFSTHCHNDLGLAVANSLAAVGAGARQVECTINGLGERAGNAALEEIVMAMRTRHDVMPWYTTIDATKITEASRLVSTITGFDVQRNKAVVGANAFAHESGIHQAGMLRHAETYEIMTPDSVGLVKTTLVMGKHSGRAAFRAKLDELGIGALGDNAFEDAFQRFKDLADRKREVYDEDIHGLIDDALMRDTRRVRLISARGNFGTDHPQMAAVELEIDGQRVCEAGVGDGGVDAAFNAIKKVLPFRPRLADYKVRALTRGTDAQAEVTVWLTEGDHTVIGQGTHTDTVTASVRAYVHALNKLFMKRERDTGPEADALSA
ncbi:MAG: 2-isopropylmalate synthase [Alphaproteobacteria bacterium]|nr:2-isopropylmalate synthase [Alphaproteobacteria bacterium]